MKWMKQISNVLGKVKHVIKFVMAIDAAIDAFKNVIDDQKTEDNGKDEKTKEVAG